MLATRFDLIAISLILFIMIVGDGGGLFFTIYEGKFRYNFISSSDLTNIAQTGLPELGKLFVGNFANISKHQV